MDIFINNDSFIKENIKLGRIKDLFEGGIEDLFEGGIDDLFEGEIED